MHQMTFRMPPKPVGESPDGGAKLLTWAVVILGTYLVFRTSFEEA